MTAVYARDCESLHISTYFYLRRVERQFTLQDRFKTTSTPCHLGGSRPWFLCPSCNRRAAIVYRPAGRQWGCVKCWNIHYDSQRDSGIKRAIRQYHSMFRKIEQELDRKGISMERRLRLEKNLNHLRHPVLVEFAQNNGHIRSDYEKEAIDLGKT
jgi:Zn-finger protein